MNPFRFAFRVIRHRPATAFLFAGAVALGASVNAALGGYAAALERTIAAQARELWAADLTVKGPGALLDRLEAWSAARWPGARAARTVEAITMARRGGAAAQTSLSAPTAAYPLTGEIRTGSGEALRDVLRPGAVVVGDKLLSSLEARVGDRVEVGGLSLRIADTVARRTDVPTSFFELAPALFMTPADLEASGLLTPGSRTVNTLFIMLPPGVDPRDALPLLRAEAAEESAEVGSWATDNPGSLRLLRTTLRYLDILGLLLLGVGGVSVTAALAASLDAAWKEMGMVLALGAPRNALVSLWGAWAAMLTGAGLAAAAVLGPVGSAGLARLFHEWMPVGGAFFSWTAFLRAGLTSLAATAGFALPVLFRLRNLPPHTILTGGDARPGKGRGFFVPLAFGRRRGVVARLAARGLARPGNLSAAVTASLSLSTGLVLGLFLLEQNLRANFADAAPPGLPNVFFINVRPGEEARFRSVAGAPVNLFPLVRGRVTAVNGVPAREIQARRDGRPGAGDRLTREFGFTFGDALLPTDKVTSGPGLWDPRAAGAQVSVFDKFHARFGIAVGDRITVNVLGRRITATVSSLRSINQSVRQPFFYFQFKPGSLEGAPYTLMGGTHLAREEISAVERRLAAALPHVTTIDLSRVAAVTGRVLGRLAAAARAMGLAGTAGGLLLLAAGLAATLSARARESVLYRTLGATAGQVARIYAVEYAWIAAASAAGGGVLGVGAAWGLTRWGLDLPFRAAPFTALLVLGGAALTVMGLSFLITRRALRAAPMEALRYE